MSRAFEFRTLEFEHLFSEHDDIKTLKPHLPEGWFYINPVAINKNSTDPGRADKIGVIFKPIDPTALGDIVDWTLIFHDKERKVSVWRAVPAYPDKYVAGGRIVLNGVDKPTKEQTAGLKVIRRDLISERDPNTIIGEIKFADEPSLTFWGIFGIDRLHIATGGFIATETSRPIGITIPAIRFFQGSIW